MAHEEECCGVFGVEKKPSFDEIRIVGKKTYAFLDSEGFKMEGEDPGFLYNNWLG
ncbi:MAG: hypothetical protein CM15mP30_5080 [Pelagibacteraceae bacterium]|nr:MAG: hypothetical protein CM15mP30_5080 [Pelagibacteraceae bacterium]